MKKLSITFILLSGLAVAGFAQEKTNPTPATHQARPSQTGVTGAQSAERPKVERPQPKSVYQVGAARVSMFERSKRDKTGERIEKSFQVQRVFVREGQERTSNTFSEAELMELKAAIDKAIADLKQKENK